MNNNSRRETSNAPITRKLPLSTGLYRQHYEKDSCGVGFMADIQGRASHRLIRDANRLLVRMAHRGAAQGQDGDGSGIMVGMPHRFFKKLSLSGELPFTLPDMGRYGVLMIFLPNGEHQESRRLALMDQIEVVVKSFKLSVLGWRSPLPTKSSILGPIGRATEPFTVQLFVCRPNDCIEDSQFLTGSEYLPALSVEEHDPYSSFSAFDFSLDGPLNVASPTVLPTDLERLLYLIRRQLAALTDMYICSCSARLVTYKGQLQSEQLFLYYDDLLDEDFASYLAIVHSRFSTNTFPTWDRAHPFRRIAHNGEINTIDSNRRWLVAREGKASCPASLGLGLHISQLVPFEEPCHVTNFTIPTCAISTGSEKAVHPSSSYPSLTGPLADTLAVPTDIIAARRGSMNSFGSEFSDDGSPIADSWRYDRDRLSRGVSTPRMAIDENFPPMDEAIENEITEENVEETVGTNSDSATLDCLVELLMMAGREIPESVMLLLQEANQKEHPLWQKQYNQYLSCIMEPWDGPALVAFTDGLQLGAQLDRNGLRPGRFVISKDGRLILASEVGVVDLPPSSIVQKGRLTPGMLLLVDFREGRIVSDGELRKRFASKHPYGQWLDNHAIHLDNLSIMMTDDELRRELHLSCPERGPVQDVSRSLPIHSLRRQSDLILPDTLMAYNDTASSMETINVTSQLEMFGYTAEKVDLLLGPMAKFAAESLGSMGNDTPLSCLSDMPRTPADFCQQLFAQGTNPAIDPIRECNVMSLSCPIGPREDLFTVSWEHARKIFIERPVVKPPEFRALVTLPGYPTATVDLTWPRHSGHLHLHLRLMQILDEADHAVRSGCRILILSDKLAGPNRFPVWSTLAVGAVHLHLIKQQRRLSCSIVVESGECCEVHQLALLLTCGADVVYPYNAYRALTQVRFSDTESPLSLDRMIENYSKAVQLGLRRVLSRMGVCTLLSYKGGYFFQPLGLDDNVIKLCFGMKNSVVGGITFDIIATDIMRLHLTAFPPRPRRGPVYNQSAMLKDDGQYRFVPDKGFELHSNHPDTIAFLQDAVSRGDFPSYRKFCDVQNALVDEIELRGQLEFIYAKRAINLHEVEPAKEIVKRFVTSAISLGAVSEEVFYTVARAMNAIGCKSNTGEGGEEDESNFASDPSRKHKIKQVASGRFGVTASYLCDAEEIQIKCGQGAKPGEGGELPGYKVVGKIAATRRSTPGVGLISPPPHHDMYSIEDVAQLILDLKHVNPKARISLKLVSKLGVGVIAAGCVKAKADHLLISGASGGTAASKIASVKHSGFPWELGLAETHQTLCLNSLREKVALQVDGQLKTGRDVVYAALLGAEEFGFASQPLISLGCVMSRKCHLNACPTGIATQDPDLRRRFRGKPEHLINYFFMVAEEVRIYMARLGFRSFKHMIGRAELLRPKAKLRDHWKRKHLNLSQLLTPGWTLSNPIDQWQGAGENLVPRAMYCRTTHDHKLDKVLDREIIRRARRTLDLMIPTTFSLPIRNVDRSVGGLLTHEIVTKFRSSGIPSESITVNFRGTAGQSFGCWLPSGVTFILSGDCNDFVAKGLSGGTVVVKPSSDSLFFNESNENVIAGNAVLYGATSGRAFFAGVLGERFAVRNSGAIAVAEGCGDYGCEYMTRGVVVILGRTGRDFAAGMSGGIAYVLDLDLDRVNLQMVDIQPLVFANCNGSERQEGSDKFQTKDVKMLSMLVSEHFKRTESATASRILANLPEYLPRFTKIIPKDIKRVLKQAISEYATTGNPEASAILDDWELMTTQANKHEGFDLLTLPQALREIAVKASRRRMQLKRLEDLNIHESALRVFGGFDFPSALSQYLAEMKRTGRVNDLLSETQGDEFSQLMRITSTIYSHWRSGLSKGLRKEDTDLIKKLLPASLTPARLGTLKRHMLDERVKLVKFLEALEGHPLADTLLKKMKSVSTSKGKTLIESNSGSLPVMCGSKDWEAFFVDAPSPEAKLKVKVKESFESPLKAARPSHFQRKLSEQFLPPLTTQDKGSKPFLVSNPDRVFGFNKYEKQLFPLKAAHSRVLDWEEIAMPRHGSSRLYNILMKTQTARCLNCDTPSCNYPNASGGGCPLGNRIPAFNSLIFEGHWKLALDRLLETNNFPEFTGRVCSAPCEDSCVLASRGSSVAIKSIELALIEKGFQEGWVRPVKPLTRTEHKVAIIGSGPAGLAAAQQLNRAGHSVTIFEKAEKAGGMLMYGIPNMKLDKKRVDQRVDMLRDEGIEFRLNTELGVDVQLEDLRKSYSAILLAIGQSVEKSLSLPGRQLKGIIQAMDFLRLSQDKLVDNDELAGIDACGKRVIVIGNGEMAVDAVATVVRMGCSHVLQLCPQEQPPIVRTPDNPWPQKADVFRVEYGHEEAALLQGRDPREYNIRIVEFTQGELGIISGIKAARVSHVTKLSNPSKLGNPSKLHSQFQIIPGTQRNYMADIIIIALGWAGIDRNFAKAIPDLHLDQNMNISATPSDYSTNIAGLFACGDCRVGPSMVVSAIAEGRDAARAIDDFFMVHASKNSPATKILDLHPMPCLAPHLTTRLPSTQSTYNPPPDLASGKYNFLPASQASWSNPLRRVNNFKGLRTVL